MAITPQTEIRLVKTPFTIDNKNQLTFINKEKQIEYFLSLPYIDKNNCTYQRKDNVIRFPAHIDTIIEYNYVIYQNNNYTDKWFFAYISNMRYVNDNMTEVEIKTDVFQTWQFDIIYKNSFVEREHVNDDTVGKHTIPEGLETGEYITDNVIYYDGLDDNKYIVRVTEWTTEGASKPLATNFGGVFSAGRCIYMFKYFRSC